MSGYMAYKISEQIIFYSNWANEEVRKMTYKRKIIYGYRDITQITLLTVISLAFYDILHFKLQNVRPAREINRKQESQWNEIFRAYSWDYFDNL